MSKYYSIHEFSKIIGVSVQTLRNWDVNGKISIKMLKDSLWTQMVTTAWIRLRLHSN
ncbi:MAG: MerR family transcriptional regulator [Pilosibacter sp.]